MSKLKWLRKSKKGVTLVELVVAIALVSIVFAATMSAIVLGFSTVLGNKSIDEASVEAEGIADAVISTISGAQESEITDLVNGGTINGVVYAGLASNTDAEYIDRIANPGADFPDQTISDPDKQFTIEPVSGIQTSKVGTPDKSFTGYKVSVAVLSSEGYVTVTAYTNSN